MCFERGAVDQQSKETHLTSHPEMSLLKASALKNMLPMVVTELRCEIVRFDLNVMC